jgi:hypothetical protein
LRERGIEGVRVRAVRVGKGVCATQAVGFNRARIELTRLEKLL